MPTRNNITGRFSLGADSLARQLFGEDFFTRIPDFEHLRSAFDECRAQYRDEVAKKGCACRVTSAWMQPCVGRVLEELDAAKKTNHDLVRKFVRFIAQRGPDENVDQFAVMIVYNQTTYDIFVDTSPPEES